MNHRFLPLIFLSIFCFAALKVDAAQRPSLAKKPAAKSARAEDAGLLLGVDFPKGATWDALRNSPDEKWVPDVLKEPHERYLTFWISRRGGTVEIQPIEGLFVPRANGFWHVGTRIVSADQNPEAAFDEQFWAVPAGEQPSPVASDPEVTDKSVRLITHVGPQYLAYLFHCECGAGSWEYVFTHVVSLDDLKTETSIEKVLGPAAGADFKRLAKSLDHMSEDPAEGEACSCCTNDEKEWGILHVGDSWQTYARFHSGPSSSCFQGSEDSAVKSAIPKSIALGVTLNRPWGVVRAEVEAILKTQEGAVRHLFVSPKRDFAVAIGTNGLAVLGIENLHIKSVLKVQAFDAPCIPIMEQWSVGRFVEGWNAAVAKEHPATVPAGEAP